MICSSLRKRSYYESKRRRLFNGLLEPDSEATQVTRNIFQTMKKEVEEAGKTFCLIFFPDPRELVQLARQASYRSNWNQMFHASCQDGTLCLDLCTVFWNMASDKFDRGCDGTHYGPKTNLEIAGAVRRCLTREGFLDP